MSWDKALGRLDEWSQRPERFEPSTTDLRTIRKAARALYRSEAVATSISKGSFWENVRHLRERLTTINRQTGDIIVRAAEMLEQGRGKEAMELLRQEIQRVESPFAEQVLRDFLTSKGERSD